MSSQTDITGVLVVNIGTPDAPDAASVRAFLREFLSDPLVFQANPLLRAAVLNLFILPFRPGRVAGAYKKIWTDHGSPLMVHSRAFTEALSKILGCDFCVKLAMRYGSPSLGSVIKEMHAEGIMRVIVFPVFPQATQATTGTVVAETLSQSKGLFTSLTFVSPFYNAEEFITALSEVSRPIIEDFKPEHVLMSFHGLPARQGERAFTFFDGTMIPGYEKQCRETAVLLAQKLQLDDWSVAFQSRLGPVRWLKPYTHVAVQELAKRGVRRLAVICPSFVTDCLETLDEIQFRMASRFRAVGGEKLRLIPSLNAHPAWIEAAMSLILKATLTIQG